MRQVITISGPIAVGKSAFIDALLKRIKGVRISTRELIQSLRKVPSERGPLQEAGDMLDRETEGKWVVNALSARARIIDDDTVAVVDSVRIAKQAEHLRAVYGANVKHVHLTASLEVLASRYISRKAVVREFATYDEARANATEADVEELAGIADLVINTDTRSTEEAAAFAIQEMRLVRVEDNR